MKISVFKKEILFWFFLIFLISYSGTFSQNVGDSACINVNKIYLPFNRDGDIAQVDFGMQGGGGYYESDYVLFSGGFFLSGIMDSVLTNGVMYNIWMKDYLAGTIIVGREDPRSAIYKLRSDDPPFGQTWQDWIDAVDLGADFYDGDGNGVYNPVDLNGNNQWDPNEDMPDILGDETYWCAYNDGVPSDERRWPMNPLGIEIRQTIFAFETDQLPLSNTIFIRYRIVNTGTVVSNLEEVIFGHPYDTDIGNLNNLGGTDTIRNAHFCYGDSTCFLPGMIPLTFLADFLSGPVNYIPGVSFIDLNGNGNYENGIDTPLDTAYVFAGQLGVRVYVGATNVNMNAGVNYEDSDPFQGEPTTPSEARNYLKGLQSNGNLVDPCTYQYGEVRGGIDCNTVNPHFWYSGDPVNNIGWVNTASTENHAIMSTDNFSLEANQTKEIMMAYIIGTGNDALSSVTAAKSLSDAIQDFYEDNFGYPIVLSADPSVAELNNFKLEQNYPNPFNPSTNIGFRISDFGFVTLKVYDILGNEVATLINEDLSPGEYEIEFNVGTSRDLSLSSGIYFYTLGAGEFSQTKKMVLMR